MINAVSERIRNIIKSQDQTPQSQLYKSRENSLDSNRSGANYKVISNNNYPPIPPKSPTKARSHINKSQIHQIQQQLRQIDSIENDQNELIQKVKNKVMEFLLPFLEQLSNKIENLTKKVGFVDQSIKSVDGLQGRWREVQKWVTQVLQRIETDMSNLQQQKLLLIQQQIKKIKNQQNTFTKKLDKITTESKANQFLQTYSPKNVTYSPPQSPQTYPIPLSLTNNQLASTTKSIFTAANTHKCKCQKLISQILQSQNHLMMELKYIKHFQDSANNTMHRQRDNQKRNYRREYR